MQTPPKAAKICPNCDKPLVQRENERLPAFNERVYCARRCHREAMRNGKHRLHTMRMTGDMGHW